MNDPFIGRGIVELLGSASEPPTREEILRRMRESLNTPVAALSKFEAAVDARYPGAIARWRRLFNDALEAGEPRVHPATDEGYARASVDRLVYGSGFVSADGSDT